jgi:23S rRNA (adenine2503-C2)-methyltransferase
MLDQLNDQPEDLAALVSWLEGLNVHVNLIPYNPISTNDPLNTTAEPKRKAFAKALRDQGFKTTLRYSLGQDITAACGQLAKEKRSRR